MLGEAVPAICFREHPVPIAEVWQLSVSWCIYSWVRRCTWNWGLAWKTSRPQLPPFLLNLRCVFRCERGYLRRCSCSPCVRTAPPSLPEWTNGRCAAMETRRFSRSLTSQWGTTTLKKTGSGSNRHLEMSCQVCVSYFNAITSPWDKYCL